MKTDITIEIEECLRHYDPSEIGGIKVNKFRNRHVAFEVPVKCGTTSHGLVDCVTIHEYFGDIERFNSCFWYKHKRDGIQHAESDCKRGFPKGKNPPRCDEKSCYWNRLHSEGIPNILFVCYEIKVTKADFKSANGHNFVGNLNYYVVPISLYPEIKDIVPDGIGIIVYYDGTQKSSRNPYTQPFIGMRRKMECKYSKLTDAQQKWLMLSVLKRIRKASD
jgi:hypothetical protein